MPEVEMKVNIKNVKNQKTGSDQAKKDKKIVKKAKPSDGQFQCPHCPATFARAQSLGGHTSRAHAGRSNVYARKTRVRGARTEKRRLLKEAKTILFKRF